MNDYNLTYWHKVTGEKLLVKRIVRGEYRFREPGSAESKSISKYLLDKEYEPDPGNFKSGTETMRTGFIKRGVKTNSKAFQEYLQRSGT